MCEFGGPDIPEAPKPKAPLPTVAQDSPAVNNAAEEARRKRAAQNGRSSTLVTGGLGESSGRATLLG